ncbi:MAG: diguanylate cyclase [Magnetococcus sp. DMHC-8]
MSAAHVATVQALERLLDLLNGKPPDLQGALAQVQHLLQQAVCAGEVQEAGAATAEIVARLILPVLANDPGRRERAQALHDFFLDDPTGHTTGAPSAQWSAQAQAFLEESAQAISSGLPVQAAPPRAGDGLPDALFARLVMALQWVGESEEALQETVARWQAHDEAAWTEAGQYLEQIRAAGHKAAAAPWQRQRRAAHDGLLRIAHDGAETLTRLGRQDAELSRLQEDAQRPEGRADWRRFHGLLHAQMAELQKEAQSLRAQQEEARTRAEQFKGRVDQLEAALAQARREQFLDPVTGIPDRFAFMAHLHRHLDRALHLGETFSLLLFHFYELQQLIDSLHDTGGLVRGQAERRLLMAVIQEMRPALPDSAFLARLSAERMVILLPRCTVPEGERMGTLIGQTLEETCFVLDGREMVLQVSFGCDAFQTGMDVAQMLETTDRLAAAAHDWKDQGPVAVQRMREC